MNDIAQLLGTKDKKEQARRIGNLQQAAQVQPVDLMIRFDPLTNQVTGFTALGGQLNADQIRIILRATEEAVRTAELQAAKQLPTSESQEENHG